MIVNTCKCVILRKYIINILKYLTFTDFNMTAPATPCEQCIKSDPRTLLHQAAGQLVECIPTPKRFKKVANEFDLSASMQVAIIQNLYNQNRVKSLYNFITNQIVFENLFMSEWYKTLAIYPICKNLADLGIGLIYTDYIDMSMSELCCRRKSPSEVAEYCVVPLNLASHLIEYGLYTDAVRLLEDFYECLDFVVSKKAIRAKVRKTMADIRSLVIIMLLSSYNSLLWFKKASHIYTMRGLSLHLMQNQHTIAAFLTECSRYCLLAGQIQTAHDHVISALTTLENSGMHARIFVNALRQASYTFMQLGKVHEARLAITHALTITYHLWKTDQINPVCEKCDECMLHLPFLDCLLDYAEYLKEVDRYNEASMVFDAVCEVRYRTIKSL